VPRVYDRPDDWGDEYDLNPWTSAPSSTRVSRYRYDFANNSVQVQWKNEKNWGYVYGIYEDIPYSQYVQFARATSKGKRINNPFNGFTYDLMTVDEVIEPSNTGRKGLLSRTGQKSPLKGKKPAPNPTLDYRSGLETMGWDVKES
jgi:hypothetical protein